MRFTKVRHQNQMLQNRILYILNKVSLNFEMLLLHFFLEHSINADLSNYSVKKYAHRYETIWHITSVMNALMTRKWQLFINIIVIIIICIISSSSSRIIIIIIIITFDLVVYFSVLSTLQVIGTPGIR